MFPQLATAAVVVLTTSAGFGVLNVAAVSLRHRLVPDHLQGRVVAAARTVTMGAASFGTLAGGAVAAGYGLDAPFVLAAVLGLVAVALWLPRLRGADPA